MVTGLDVFKDRLGAHSDGYVMIGGTACSLLMEREGIPFRATRDLDMVVVVERMTREFAEDLWAFLREGGYRNLQQRLGDDTVQLYRFDHPATEEFPVMLELFCRAPLPLMPRTDGATITPLPLDDELSSLSAILLDPEAYGFVTSGSLLVDGISVLSATHLIALKAQAWVDLKERKDAGEKVDSTAVRKHPKDIARLAAVLLPESKIELPRKLKEDLTTFVSTDHGLAGEPLKAAALTEPELHALLRDVFQIG